MAWYKSPSPRASAALLSARARASRSATRRFEAANAGPRSASPGSATAPAPGPRRVEAYVPAMSSACVDGGASPPSTASASRRARVAPGLALPTMRMRNGVKSNCEQDTSYSANTVEKSRGVNVAFTCTLPLPGMTPDSGASWMDGCVSTGARVNSNSTGTAEERGSTLVTGCPSSTSGNVSCLGMENLCMTCQGEGRGGGGRRVGGRCQVARTVEHARGTHAAPHAAPGRQTPPE